MRRHLDELGQMLGRNGDFDPVQRRNFVESITWIDDDMWFAIRDAFHRNDDAEFGRLLAQAAHRYWLKEARLCV